MALDRPTDFAKVEDHARRRHALGDARFALWRKLIVHAERHERAEREAYRGETMGLIPPASVAALATADDLDALVSLGFVERGTRGTDEPRYFIAGWLDADEAKRVPWRT